MQVKKFEAPSMKEALEMVKVQLGPDAIILSAKDHRSSFGLLAKGSVEVTAAVSENQMRKRFAAESRLPQHQREKFRERPARVQKQFIEKVFARAPGTEVEFTEGPTATPRAVPRPMDPMSHRRYIDITDEEPGERQAAAARAMGKRVTDMLEDLDGSASPQRSSNQRAESSRQTAPSSKTRVQEPAGPGRAEERVKSAVRSAIKAGENLVYDRATAAKKRRPEPLLNANGFQDPEPHQRETRLESAAPSPQTAAEMTALQEEIRQLQEVIQSLKSTPKTTPITLHPGADVGISFELSSIYEKLTQAGMNPQFVLPMLEEVRKSMDPLQLKKKHIVESWLARQMMDRIEVVQKPSDGRVHMFVGPSGQGKTSALVKMASHLVIKEKRHVAILTTDTSKVGAADQLRIYAQILNVPFGVIRSRDDWETLMQHLTQYDAILVDTPGGSLRTLEEIDRLRAILPPSHVQRNMHYVQAATARDSDAMEIARRYQMTNFTDVIFTNLDESTSHGIIANFQSTFKVPLHSFSTGPLIPEDYEWATRERVIDLIFKISKIRSTERGS